VQLPSGVAALVADLREHGFEITNEVWSPARRSGSIEMAARRRGVSRVRITEDREAWEVEVKIGFGWYYPWTALLALQDLPHEERAMGHEERRAATVALVRELTGDRAQIQKIKARQKQLTEAYTRWAEGKSDTKPFG
jgi:hypothetical protein